MKRYVAHLMTGIALVALMAAPAAAQSSKAAWRYDDLIGLAAAANVAAPTYDTGWVTILTTHIKTPNAKELAIGVSLQCGIVTDTTVRSRNGETDSASARGRIKVQVKITQPDGTEVYAQPNNGATLDGDADQEAGITFCDRYQKLQAKFSGLNCYVDVNDTDADGVFNEILCSDPEELQLILKTLNANHFNFLHANAVPGVQKVEVQAKAESVVALGGTQLGAAGAEAFVGAGAVSVETIRLVKDSDGTIDLTDLR